jgi:hypothetical protein
LNLADHAREVVESAGVAELTHEPQSPLEIQIADGFE